MALNYNAIIDITYFNQMWQGEAIDPDRLENLINGISAAFDQFCNRPLVECVYTNVEGSQDLDADVPVVYNLDMTVFDAPPRTTFWYPTYPVASITSFSISGTAILPTTTYIADEGYILYRKAGKLIYDYGFDYPYRNNIITVWQGGYSLSSPEMSHLRYLCFLAIRDIINSPQNMTYESEKIGQYSYKTVPTYFLKTLQGLSPKVFSDMSKYRREVIG